MRRSALIVALYLTSTLAACAQPGPDGPPPGYGQNGAAPGYAQQGWAGGMQSAPGPNAGPGAGAGPAPGPGPMPQSAPPMAMGEEHGGMAAKFRRANVTGDGRLTQQQAQAGGMRGVAKHFAQIDRDQKGYVTMEDVRAWHQAHKERKMEKREAQGQTTGAPAGGGYPPPSGSDGQQY